MNKKMIIKIIAAILAIAALGIGFLYWYDNLTYKITIKSDTDTVSFAIYDKDSLVSSDDSKKTPINNQPLKNNETIDLKVGQYVIRSSDPEKYNILSENEFTVERKASDVSVKTEYSESYLSDMASKEKEALETVARTYVSSLGFTSSSFVIGDGALLGHGEWYATTAYAKPPEEGSFVPFDWYYLLFKKDEKGTWTMKLSNPLLVLTKDNAPNIPLHILQKTNNISVN